MRFYLLATLLAAGLSLHAFDHEHSGFDALLSRHVENGLVDYAAIHRQPGPLNNYLDLLRSVGKRDLAAWTRNQQLAYWINAYNAYTIKAIVDHYPLKRRGVKGFAFPANSIRQIPGVWDKLKWLAGGERLTLNQMEHEKMRAELKEPRIHFAINCASIGCPILPAEAFAASRLESQLEAASKAFVTDRQRVRLDRADRKLYLSKIFEWFGEDFEPFDDLDGYGKYDGVVGFVADYSPDSTAAYIRGRRPEIEWLDYDWSLNELKR